MNPSAPNKFQPALYGGLFIGVLSALPIINLGNCLCCMWVLAGGALATYLLQQNHPYSVSAADGALSGLLAGVIGGVVSAVLSIPLMMMMGPFQKQIMERILASNPDIPDQTRQMIENMGASGAGAAAFAIKMVFGVCIDAVFGMLGGLLGVAMFKKKDLPPPPGTVDVLPPA